MKTRGMIFLDEKKVDYQIKEYEFNEKGAVYAASSLNWPLSAMIKSIVIKGEKNFFLALIGGDKEISLKKAAQVLKEKKIVLASIEEAERISGYKVGGISPFGFKKQIQILLDKSLLKHDKIAINAGARGMIAILKLSDLINLISPIIYDISID
ncbi:MAG: YbaK/EbsC family protein [Spirochaetota bacterium]